MKTLSQEQLFHIVDNLNWYDIAYRAYTNRKEGQEYFVYLNLKNGEIEYSPDNLESDELVLLLYIDSDYPYYKEWDYEQFLSDDEYDECYDLIDNGFVDTLEEAMEYLDIDVDDFYVEWLAKDAAKMAGLAKKEIVEKLPILNNNKKEV